MELKRRLLAVLFLIPLLLFAISGCVRTPDASSLPTATSTFTLSPPLQSPTVEFPTTTPPPFNLETPAIVIEPPVLIPTITTTPPPVGLPDETLTIFSPGPGSQLTSPFTVSGFGGPSEDDVVYLRLIGEDGEILARRTGYLLVLTGNPGRFYTEMEFSVDLVAEEARLELSMNSPTTGNISHLTSVNVILLSTGLPLVRTAIRGPERLTLLSPPPESRVDGNRVLVSGVGWVESDRPLSIELRDIRGEVLGSTSATLLAPAVGELGTFEAELSYDVAYPQWGTIIVAETSANRIPGIIHLSSVDVWLSP